MATLEFLVYQATRPGEPYIVVGLHRTRLSVSVTSTCVASTRAEAERIREQREQELREQLNAPDSERKPEKAAKRPLSKRGKWMLTPRTKNA